MQRFVRTLAFDFGHTLVDERFVYRSAQLMPGVRQALPQINLPMAVWANTRTTREADVRHILRAADIESFFSSVVTSLDAGFRKPAPEFFQCALARGNQEKAEVLFVGNQLNSDVLGGERYGIRTAWLSGPEFRSDDETLTLADIKPSFVLKDLRDLLPLLQNIAW